MWIGYLVKVAKKFKGQLLFKENEFEWAQMSALFLSVQVKNCPSAPKVLTLELHITILRAS